MRLADVKIAPLVGAVGLGERAGGVDPVLEVLGHRRELTRVHRLGRPQQGALFFPDCRGAHVLGRARQHGDMLVAHVATRKRRLGLGQLLQLAGDFHPLHGCAAGELALPAQPGDQ